MANSSQPSSCLRLGLPLSLKAAGEGSNFVFSPLSIGTALALAAEGAVGETLSQFLSFMDSSTIEELNTSFANVLMALRFPSHGGGDVAAPLLEFATGLWADRSVELHRGFMEIASSVYQAKAESADFKNEASEVTQKVNDWVKVETHGHIDNLLPDGSVNESTQLVLVNAIYFKGVWEEKFDRSLTTFGEFHLLNGTTVQAPFMTSREEQLISSFDGFKVLGLPYQSREESKRFSMLIFLPNSNDDFNCLVENATNDPSFILEHIPNRKIKVGQFRIPKFKISTKFEATKTLKSLGLQLPFSENADVTRMSPAEGLSISGVHHQATIEVEEEGTVAAAATGVAGFGSALRTTEDFEANHPFIFAIIEDSSKVVLFFGHVVNPLLE